MQRYIARKNVERLERMLFEESDPQRIEEIGVFLAEAQAELDSLTDPDQEEEA